jgi:hypothetical protein
MKLDAVIAAGLSRLGVPEGVSAEELRRVIDIVEQRIARQLSSHLGADCDRGLLIRAHQIEVAVPIRLGDVEGATAMFSGEHPSAEQDSEARARVPSGDEDAVTDARIGVPLDSKSVSGALNGHAESAGKAARSNLCESDQTDAGDRRAAFKVRSKRGRYDAAGNIGVDAEVQQ